MGVGRGGAWLPRILKLLAKRGCFFNFEGQKTNFTVFGPPWKEFWKNPLLPPPGKKPSDAQEGFFPGGGNFRRILPTNPSDAQKNPSGS